MTDSWTLYRDIRDSFLSQLESLPAEAAQTIVPLCPEWRVVDVVAHVCGLNTDLAAGMRVGLGSEESTTRQVAEHSEMTLAEIADEWRGLSEQIEAIYAEIPDFGMALIGDLIMHVHDVQHALGLPVDPDITGIGPAAARYATRIESQVADRLDTTLSINLTDADRPGDGKAPLRLDVSSYDLMRSVAGRRSRAQVEALDWSGDPARVLDDAWLTYGPFQVEDVSV